MKTNIYALTDSHQESRNLSKLLSGIYNFEKDKGFPFLILDGGDLFKGIYSKDLSVNAYLKIKELLPQANIFLTLGNNDFGFKKADFEYLKSVIEKFKKADIHFVCANLYDEKTDCPADFVSRYKIAKLNGTKFLITGFCINNSCSRKFGLTLKEQKEAYKNLVSEVNEPYDKIIVLNHHWVTYSKELKEYSKTLGEKYEADLIIGGHEHSPKPADYENKIFYPLSFARGMYRMTFENSFEDIEEILLQDIDYTDELEIPVAQYEKDTGLMKPVAKRVLNLTKTYSDPCPLGTFISDYMKKIAKTDIAFHSTGFTMFHLKLDDSDIITRYDVDRVICEGSSSICRIVLSVDELKQVFENATKYRMLKDRGNARFVQCSRNIKLTGKGNNSDNSYKIIQICINGEDLLDENQKPKDGNKKFSCAIDSYIGAGEQGFDVLKNIPKENILKDDKNLTLNELLFDAVCDAEKNFDGNPDYPCYCIADCV